MFNQSKRYITRGVEQKTSDELRRLIWDLVDLFITNREQGDVDYLQYFELSVEQRNGHDLQRIIHRQEQPAYMEDTIFEVDRTFEGAILVYDEVDVSIMMLAEEY